MSLTKAWVSGGGGGAAGRPASSGEVLKTGYIKKLKTMKKKYFVLRAESGESPSCLEYYDSEKKWKAQQPPKRVIALKSCFNINRRWDLKQRFVVALYTKDDCFCLALDSEEEADQWLSALLSTQRGGDDSAEGEPPKPTFEHVWQVQVQKKGLGSSRNILGPYMLCLTSHSLTLVRNGGSTPTATSSSTQPGTATTVNEVLNDTVEFSLSTIRRCGHSDCFFYMEVGRSSVTGAGELWMQTEDTYIAQNMHGAILHAMSSSRNGATSTQKVDRDAELGPHPRTRSSSANEASRPVSVLQRGSSARYAHQSSSNQGQLGSNAPSPGSTSAPAPTAGGSWRPQALPHPHSQHTSQMQRFGGWVGGGQRVHHAPIPQNVLHQQPASATSPSQRRHSVSGTGSRERCDSLPSRARTISEGPPSSSLPTGHHPSPPTAYSPSSTHHHHHHVLHHHHILHHPASVGSSAGSQYGQHGIVVRGVHLVPTGPTPAGSRPHSMYSRGLSYSPPIISSPVSPASGACSTTDSAGSSLSMEEGEGWCGSNGGMGIQEVGEVGFGSSSSTSHGPRYGHSLTPDEPAILEENVDDEYMPWGPGTGLEMEEEELTGDAEDEEDKVKNGRENGEEGDEVDGVGHVRRRRSKKGKGKNPRDYVPMGAVRSKTFPSPNPPTSALPPHAIPTTTSSAPPPHHHTASLSLPIQPVTLGRPSPLHRTPPSGYSRTQPGFKSGSPSSQHGAYMEMHSPCGTSPLESSDGYMPMSPGSGGCPPIPGEGSATKVLQAVQQEGGYVPMTPGHPPDDGYVDMDPHQNANNKSHHEDGSVSGRGDMSPAASSCSVTSGTPSTDTRFSEYHLEKVSSYFTPSEEEEDGHGSVRGDDILPMERPVRAYSVGSRPETFRRKNWLEVSNIDSMRVRAFSVGSRQGVTARPPGPGRSVGGASSPSHHSPHRHFPHHTHVFAPSPMAPNIRKGASSPKGTPSSQSKKSSKSSSAPLLQSLSSSWSGSSTLCSPPASTPSPYSQASGSIRPKQGHANASIDSADHDLMELDFSGRGSRMESVETSGVNSLPNSLKKKAEETPVKEEASYVPMGVPPPISNYQEMRLGEGAPSSFSPPLLLSPPSGGNTSGKAPSSASSASSSVTLEEYVDMNFKKEEGSSDSGNASSGYMEMYPARKSSVVSEGNPGDYVNMEGGERLVRSKGSVPEASRPIAIRKERREDGGVSGKEGGRGHSPNFSLAGLLSRKSSSGTPPKGPFSDAISSPFSSLRRGRKKRGGEEEESEAGDDGNSHKESADLPTPTAIFPFSLNSPGSPVRHFPGHYESASKCPVDATSGTVHISYPYVPSSPVATAGSVMPSRAKVDVRRRSEYSVPGGVTGKSGSPPKRDGKRRNERPLSQSSPISMEGVNVSTSPPTAVSPPNSAHEYANYCPSPPKQDSGKSSSIGSDDYMPMAPSGRVRKESVVSGPGELMAMAHSMNNHPSVTLPSPSSLFSSFSPSATFAGSSRQKPSSDYVCMKASPSNPVMTSASPRSTTASQRVKSSSADYMEINIGSEAPKPARKVSANADDYVEIDLSQKPGVIVEKTVTTTAGAAVSAPKMIPSVGTYIPSHTGFGFHPQFSSSMSTSSTRPPPPPPASYTWPRKGVETRKGESSSSSPSGANSSGSTVPTANSKPLNRGKTDDYVQMDLGPKSIASSSSNVPLRAYTGSSSLTSHFPSRRLSSGISVSNAIVPPPSTTATVTATTTTTTSVTSSFASPSMSLVASVATTIPSTLPPPPLSPSITSLPPTYKPYSSANSYDPKRILTSVKSSVSSQALQETTATTVPQQKEKMQPQAATTTPINVTLPLTTFVPTMTSSTAVVTSAPIVVTSALSVTVSTSSVMPSSPKGNNGSKISVISSSANLVTDSSPVVISANPTPLVSSFSSGKASSPSVASVSCSNPTTQPISAVNVTSALAATCTPVASSAPIVATVLTSSSVDTVTSTPKVSSTATVTTSNQVVTSPALSTIKLAGSFNIPAKYSSKSRVNASLNPITYSTASTVTPVSTSSAVITNNSEMKEPSISEKQDNLKSENLSSPLKPNGTQHKAQQANIMPLSKSASEGESKGQRDKSDCVAPLSDCVKDSGKDCCQVAGRSENCHPAPPKESSEVGIPEGTTRLTDSCTTENAGVTSSRPAHRTDSKRGRGGSSNREVCRRNSGDKTEGGHLPRRGSEERALGRGRGSDGSEGRGTRTRRRSSDIAKNQETQQGNKLNRQGSGLSRTGLQDGEDDNGSYEKLLAPAGRQQRKWQHNSLGERTPGMSLNPGLGPLRRQMSSPSAVADPDGAYEKLLPTNGAASSRRRSGDKVGNLGLMVGDGIPTPVFSASSSSASSSSSLASVASSVLLGPAGLRSSSTSSPPPTALATAPPSPGEIHYASLDLAPPIGTDTEEGGRCGRRSPRVFTGRSGAESPSTTGAVGSSSVEQPLNYAEIDFSKSIAPSVKNRVRH